MPSPVSFLYKVPGTPVWETRWLHRNTPDTAFLAEFLFVGQAPLNCRQDGIQVIQEKAVGAPIAGLTDKTFKSGQKGGQEFHDAGLGSFGPRKWSKIACGVTQQIWGVFAPFFEPDGIAVVDIPAHDLLHIYRCPRVMPSVEYFLDADRYARFNIY